MTREEQDAAQDADQPALELEYKYHAAADLIADIGWDEFIEGVLPMVKALQYNRNQKRLDEKERQMRAAGEINW